MPLSAVILHIVIPSSQGPGQVYCLFLSSESRTKKYLINTVANNNSDVMIMDLWKTKVRVESQEIIGHKKHKFTPLKFKFLNSPNIKVA